MVGTRCCASLLGYHRCGRGAPRPYLACKTTPDGCPVAPFAKGDIIAVPSLGNAHGSETELQRELQGTAVVECVGDLTEIRIDQIAPRLGKLRSVKQVDGFDAKQYLLL